MQHYRYVGTLNEDLEKLGLAPNAKRSMDGLISGLSEEIGEHNELSRSLRIPEIKKESVMPLGEDKEISRVESKEEIDEALKAQRMKKMTSGERAVARRVYRKKRSKVSRVLKTLRKKSSYKKRKAKFKKLKGKKSAGSRKRFVMSGIDAMANIAESLQASSKSISEETLTKDQLVLALESIKSISGSLCAKYANFFAEDKESPEEKKLVVSIKDHPGFFDKDEAGELTISPDGKYKIHLNDHDFTFRDKEHMNKYFNYSHSEGKESPEEKKLGYDLGYLGKEWDELEDWEEEGDEVKDPNEKDLAYIGKEWDEMDDAEKEGKDVKDQNKDDKDYVGAQESVMIDLRAMGEDIESIKAKLGEGKIHLGDAKKVIAEMSSYVASAMMNLIKLAEAEFKYVGSDEPDEENQKPESPETGNKYVGDDEPSVEKAKPEVPEAGNKYIGQDEPNVNNVKPTSPEAGSKYVGKDKELNAEKTQPVAPQSGSKYVGQDKELNANKEKPVSPQSNKYVGQDNPYNNQSGEVPVQKKAGSEVPVIESSEISLGKGNRSIPSDSNMGKWMIAQFKKMGVAEEDKEDVATVLSSIWNQSKTIYVGSKAKKYSKQLMDLDDKEGSKGNASFVESNEMVQSIANSIMQKMHKIEKAKGKMFSQIDAALEDDIFDAIDSKNVARLNDISKKMDSMDSGLKEDDLVPSTEPTDSIEPVASTEPVEPTEPEVIPEPKRDKRAIVREMEFLLRAADKLAMPKPGYGVFDPEATISSGKEELYDKYKAQWDNLVSELHAD